MFTIICFDIHDSFFESDWTRSFIFFEEDNTGINFFDKGSITASNFDYFGMYI
jgi:hypothetical protein